MFQTRFAPPSSLTAYVTRCQPPPAMHRRPDSVQMTHAIGGRPTREAVDGPFADARAGRPRRRQSTALVRPADERDFTCSWVSIVVVKTPTL